VFVLRMGGIGASGVVRQARLNRIARVLLEEASNCYVDSIIVSARRSRCWWDPLSRGVRERLIKRSSHLVVLVPPRSPLKLLRHGAADRTFR
jgi:hypothetical protein